MAERRWNAGCVPAHNDAVAEPELAVLRDAIRLRGPADVPGAAAVVEEYLGGVLRDAGAAGKDAAGGWGRGGQRGGAARGRGPSAAVHGGQLGHRVRGAGGAAAGVPGAARGVAGPA